VAGILFLTILSGCQSVTQDSEDKLRIGWWAQGLKGEFDLLDRPFQKLPKPPYAECFLATKIKFDQKIAVDAEQNAIQNEGKILATLTQKHVGPCPHVKMEIEPRIFLLEKFTEVTCKLKIYEGKGVDPGSPELISITDNRKRERNCERGLGDLDIKITKADGAQVSFYTPDR
jgi:hypothetical protein